MGKRTKEQEAEISLRKNPINVFQCGHPDCIKTGEFEHKDFKRHLLDVHGITADQIKGHRQMTMHMDGSYWFSSNFTWTLEGGLEFKQYVRMARPKNDFMKH